MGGDGFMTPKAIANRIKAKGLLKLRFYCQICEKACRDENGFKCHCASEAHQRQMLLVAENPDKYVSSYTREFQQEFVKLLSRRHGTKRVLANQVYQEYIADRNHLHMNATRWNTLTDFVKYLGKEGICHVEETEKGWYITWIDNSPKALARQAAIQKKERQEVDDEERTQRLLREQIEKAQQDADRQPKEDDQVKELVRENEQQPIKLNLFAKSSTPAVASDTTSAATGATKTKMTMMGGLKKGGGLSALAKKSFTNKSLDAKDKSTSIAAPEKRKLTAMEEIIAAEQEQKRRKEMKSNGVSYNSYDRGLNGSRDGSRRHRSRSPSPSRGQGRHHYDDRRVRA
ncbi:domain of Kin17 curved DNA-binding protein-domain-containing protein [Umbelopsis sp. PMI_123]|nr:domain of Kin17 curved DNA-binding protein-domain-containing protein [Umbelopsis sp. PMI_123]